MYPSEFAKAAGGLFLLLALLGIVHVLGPTSADSFLRTAGWLDVSESILFACLGLVLLSTLLVSCGAQRIVILWLDWFLVFLFVWGLFKDSILTMHIESPVEPIFFALLAIWGHLAGVCEEPKKKT